MLTTILFANERTFNVISSHAEHIADLSQEKSSFIAGVISPLSGQVYLQVTDLIAKGAQSIHVNRIYIPSTLRNPVAHLSSKWERFVHQQQYDLELQAAYKGWIHFPHCYIQFESPHLKIPDPNGTVLEYRVQGNKGILSSSAFGMCNASGEVCSGKYDLRNIEVLLDGNDIRVIASDGTERFYSRVTHAFWRLKKEILPNGKVLKYHYKRELVLERVESLDPSEQHVYTSVSLDGVLSATASCALQNRAGDVASYSGNKPTRTGKGKKDGLKVDYSYTYPPVISKASSPNFANETIGYENEFGLSSYDGKEQVFQCSYQLGADSVYRVGTLSLPTGKNGEFVQQYQISYEPTVAGNKGGSTTVLRSDGIRMLYTYNKMLLLESVKWFLSDGSLAKQKKYEWTDRQFLKKVSWKDGDGTLFYSKTFQHDHFGNPELEILEGQLTGESGNQQRITKRVFSQDRKHLLLREEHDNGKTVIYKYHKNTNLLASKFICEREKVFAREFWKYDDCNNLIEHVVDDGKSLDPTSLSEVTERKISRYRLSSNAHCLHMPEWTEEYFWDGSKEQLLRKTHYTYDKRVNVTCEKIYDANEQFCYEIAREFDAQGNILWEIDPIGQKIEQIYDPKGLLKTRYDCSKKLKEERSYNKNGSVIQIDETADSGEIHATRYEYDSLDRLTKTTDYLGATTEQEPDPLSGQARLIKGPFGEISTFSYDSFGNQISFTNALGNTTKYGYNIFGDRTSVLYPDGARETSVYFSSGTLKSHTNLDALTTTYMRDSLDRLTQISYQKNNQTLAQETFTYTPLQLHSHVDKEGNTTSYEYDGAGRKILQKSGNRFIAFSYDSLGRIESENHSDLCFKEYKKDWLGRITEERKVGEQGQILWKQKTDYTFKNNQKIITNYPNNQAANEIFEFDSFERLIFHTTALGYTTKSSYTQENKCLVKTTTDPNGISTITKFDPYEREIDQQIGSNYRKEQLYDPAGNLEQVREGRWVTRYTYDTNNRIHTIIRGFSSPDERKTIFTYTGQNRIHRKTTPDGLTLTHAYNAFGDLESVHSSDQSINQSFAYNKNGHLLFAQDKDHVLERRVDRFGNLLEEIIDGKLILQKTYDRLGRLQVITLPDKSTILYTYDACHLKTIERFSAQGQRLFIHEYTAYDLSGHLLEEKLIHELGSVKYSYLSSGNLECIQSPFFRETISYEPNGRIQSLSNDGSYCYDDLSQLTQERSHSYQYDNHYNRTARDSETTNYDLLDEIKSPQIEYDLRGNLIRHGNWEYFYDALNRLTLASNGQQNIHFTYDALDRQITRSNSNQTEYYLYHGTEELASFYPNGALKDLKVPGSFLKPIAIELQKTSFAPILDYRGNVRHLIDAQSTLSASYQYTAFGEALLTAQLSNPWRYSAKRLDPDLNLYLFGKRFYSPPLSRWLTTDPAGFIDSTNLYAYVLNNPLIYTDPTGESLLGFLCGLGQIIAGGTIMLTGVGLEIITFGGYSFAFGLHEATGFALMSSGCIQATLHARDLSFEKRSSRPDPDPRAEGNPHTIIQVPGATGTYTTHNGDGTYKQYRGSGKPHGNIPRPNVKETKNNPSPNGPKPGKPEVRKPTADEIPKSKSGV